MNRSTDLEGGTAEDPAGAMTESGVDASLCQIPFVITKSCRSILLRRIAAFLLMLAIPLRVYAAAAMVFCGQPDPQRADPGAAPSAIEMHADASEQSVEPCSLEGDHEVGSADPHGHLSCAACCCTGMITAAQKDWEPQTFAAPATTALVATAIPLPVPDRPERPPRILLA